MQESQHISFLVIVKGGNDQKQNSSIQWQVFHTVLSTMSIFSEGISCSQIGPFFLSFHNLSQQICHIGKFDSILKWVHHMHILIGHFMNVSLQLSEARRAFGPKLRSCVTGYEICFVSTYDGVDELSFSSLVSQQNDCCSDRKRWWWCYVSAERSSC